jgi:hypothetical protein
MLGWLKNHQRLGSPGIKATAIPGTLVMNVDLPEKVLDFTSTNLPPEQVVLDYLPKDTSYAQRLYTASDGFRVSGNIVLMGMDRTSIHKPEICLPGQGWRIEQKTVVDVPIGGPCPYRMPVAKWIASNVARTADGQSRPVGGVYVFWFVADNEQTVSHPQRMWWLARDLLLKGVLQRWAYVSYFSLCDPGQEEATFERIKQLIAASVPEFQWPPKTAGAATVAKQ